MNETVKRGRGRPRKVVRSVDIPVKFGGLPEVTILEGKALKSGPNLEECEVAIRGMVEELSEARGVVLRLEDRLGRLRGLFNLVAPVFEKVVLSEQAVNKYVETAE